VVAWAAADAGVAASAPVATTAGVAASAPVATRAQPHRTQDNSRLEIRIMNALLVESGAYSSVHGWGKSGQSACCARGAAGTQAIAVRERARARAAVRGGPVRG